MGVSYAVTEAVTDTPVKGSVEFGVGEPHATSLAKLSLMLFGIEAVVRLSSRVDLGSAPPGTRLPLAIVIILHNAAWYLYLQISRRVRDTYGLESQSRTP